MEGAGFSACGQCSWTWMYLARFMFFSHWTDDGVFAPGCALFNHFLAVIIFSAWCVDAVYSCKFGIEGAHQAQAPNNEHRDCRNRVYGFSGFISICASPLSSVYACVRMECQTDAFPLGTVCAHGCWIKAVCSYWTLMSQKQGDSKDIQSGAEVQSRCWEEEMEWNG